MQRVQGTYLHWLIKAIISSLPLFLNMNLGSLLPVRHAFKMTHLIYFSLNTLRVRSS